VLELKTQEEGWFEQFPVQPQGKPWLWAQPQKESDVALMQPLEQDY
jgi:hypothetical protein